MSQLEDTGTNLATQLRAQCATQPAGRRWTWALVGTFGAVTVAYLLLWSKWWYPLSDSSLFLALARNLDAGRGYTYMGRPHYMVTPLTSLMLWGLMQFSRSFSLMNASMIACMLGSFVFMYLSLREYLDRKMALLLMAVSALTYWQFRLATIIGSDQPFLLLWWLSVYAFLAARRDGSRRNLWLTLAAAALVGGIGFRIAGGLFVPVVAAVVWMDYRKQMPWRRLAILLTAVLLPAVLAGGAYEVWQLRVRADRKSEDPVRLARLPREFVPVPALGGTSPLLTATAEENAAAEVPLGAEITSYELHAKFGLKTFYLYPGVLGRWLAEVLWSPSRVIVFGHLRLALQMLLGTLVALVAGVGLYEQYRAGWWWLSLPVLYVLMVVLWWGSRYIPRYLVPVVPMVLLWMSVGTGRLLSGAAIRLGASGSRAESLRRAACWGVPLLVLALNLPVLAVEVYAGHARDFYGTIRQGSAAELVDAADVVRRLLPPDTIVVTNDKDRRREIHLLTGRPVALQNDLRINGPHDTSRIERLFHRSGARCAIIHYLDSPYQEFHVSLGKKATGPWWGLYILDEKQGKIVRVDLSKQAGDRTWLLQVPDSSM